MKSKIRVFFIVLSLSATVIVSVLKIAKFMHYDFNNKLTDNQQQILAAEYDMNNISDKIISVSHRKGVLSIDVGYFDTVEALLDNLDFKSDKHYKMVSERKDNFTYEYKKISGAKVNTMRLDSERFLDLKNPCVVYIYKDSKGYVFTVEKESISNSEIYNMFE